MPPLLALSTPPCAPPSPASRQGVVRARVAVYSHPVLPPLVRELSADDPAELIELLFAAAAQACVLPGLAVREVVENLVHAGFAEALVSVLDAGHTLRVSDRGPGIADPERAVQPGFSTAGAPVRALVRGVGCGLPLAAALLRAAGGTLDVADNLGGGAVVTLSIPPAPEPTDAPAPGPAPAPTTPTADALADESRLILALLMELERAEVAGLARELGNPIAACGRELALLEHHGLVERDRGGYALSTPGRALVASLF